MSENVVSIDKNLNICDCLRMMYKDNLSRIPVTSTNENKKVKPTAKTLEKKSFLQTDGNTLGN